MSPNASHIQCRSPDCPGIVPFRQDICLQPMENNPVKRNSAWTLRNFGLVTRLVNIRLVTQRTPQIAPVLADHLAARQQKPVSVPSQMQKPRAWGHEPGV